MHSDWLALEMFDRLFSKCGVLTHWLYGATAARLTPDQKVGSSNLSVVIFSSDGYVGCASPLADHLAQAWGGLRAQWLEVHIWRARLRKHCAAAHSMPRAPHTPSRCIHWRAILPAQTPSPPPSQGEANKNNERKTMPCGWNYVQSLRQTLRL